jgi:hypothetical protein
MMAGMWTSDDARRLAAEHVADLGDRWSHVRQVGTLASDLVRRSGADDVVSAAAWLHDIGYADEVRRSGFHPLDGALFLSQLGAPAELVGLVGHHTGARYEAEERGLLAEWAELPAPTPHNLDLLTFVDLTVGPTGSVMTPRERISEILGRYGADHAVHRAVTRSAPELLAASERARTRLGLSDEWPVDAA